MALLPYTRRVSTQRTRPPRDGGRDGRPGRDRDAEASTDADVEIEDADAAGGDRGADEPAEGDE
jgi:hypothetical protein